MHPGSSPDPRLGPSPCLDPDLDSSLVLDLTRKQSPTPNRFLGVGPGLGVRIRTSLRTEVVGRGFPCSHRTSTGVVRPTHCRCQTAGRSVDVPGGTWWTHCCCQTAGRSADVPGGTWWTHCRCQTAGRSVDVPGGTWWTHCRCQTSGRSVDVPAGTWWTHCRCHMAGRFADVSGGTWWTHVADCSDCRSRDPSTAAQHPPGH